jgi:hypothetical protein
MTVAVVITALGMPPEARVDQRVPKKLLVENGAPTAADRRQINDGIEELLWVAALKPGTIGVPEFRDGTREYLEIAVLSLVLRPDAKAKGDRLVEIIHRAIPYPVVLVTEQGGEVTLSLARKRLSQNEADRMVLEGLPTGCLVDDGAIAAAWLGSLSVSAQARAHLLALYDGWIARVEALQAAMIVGRLREDSDPGGKELRREALAEHSRLQRDIAVLRARAEKESQMNRRVELNLELKRLESALAGAVQNL